MKLLLAFMAFSAGVSIACSATRSATSPTQAADPPTNTQSATPLVNSAMQEKSSCSLSVSQAPVIKGLKLGMLRDEVLSLFPGSREDPELSRQLSAPANKFGSSSFTIKPSKHESGEKFADVSQIVFSLLDGRVWKIYWGFNGPAWPHVDKFVEKFVEGTGLPALDHWQAYVGMDNQLKTLTCVDFDVQVFAGGKGGSLNYVMMQDLEADKNLRERSKPREQASPTPGQ
jgi:hypothetical protein